MERIFYGWKYVEKKIFLWIISSFGLFQNIEKLVCKDDIESFVQEKYLLVIAFLFFLHLHGSWEIDVNEIFPWFARILNQNYSDASIYKHKFQKWERERGDTVHEQYKYGISEYFRLYFAKLHIIIHFAPE